jgi:exopolysaccharide biosynthesis predicted pyruvyltransferase EpsI
MAPDIVFTLGKSISLSQTKKKYSIGVCLRDDNESSFSEEGRKQFISILSKKYRTIKKLTTMCKDSTDILKEEERQQYIMNILYDFSECNLIITDRLLGMIFSVLSNVPCCVIDNLNHKVSGVFKTIQGCSEGITLCRDMHFDGIFENLNSKTCRLTNMDDKYKALYECLKG